jgi:lipopolysaccharide transport system permease protein
VVRMMPSKKTGNWSAAEMVRTILRHRRVLRATTKVELAKRYSGSAFGLLWVVLFPALLLGIYLFVYLVIFKMRFPGYSEMDYVLYVFAGLIPYIGFSDALNLGTVSVRQNIHLVKNVILPIELIPVRAVATSMPSQLVSLGVLLILIVGHGGVSWKLAFLPLVLLVQILFLIGLVLILAPLATALPDVTYFVNLGLLLLIFISPIGFKPDMVPSSLAFMVRLNPIHYMIETFRECLLADHAPRLLPLLVFATQALTVFTAGCAFFRKTRGFLLDYE